MSGAGGLGGGLRCAVSTGVVNHRGETLPSCSPPWWSYKARRRKDGSGLCLGGMVGSDSGLDRGGDWRNGGCLCLNGGGMWCSR